MIFRLEILKNQELIRTSNQYQLAEFDNIVYENARLYIDFKGNTWFVYFDKKWHFEKIDPNRYYLLSL